MAWLRMRRWRQLMGSELVGVMAVGTVFVEGPAGTLEAFTEAERAIVRGAVLSAEMALWRFSKQFSPDHVVQCSFFNEERIAVISPGFISPPTNTTANPELRSSEIDTREQQWRDLALAAIGFPTPVGETDVAAGYRRSLLHKNWGVPQKPRRSVVLFVTKFPTGWMAYALEPHSRLTVQFDWISSRSTNFQSTGTKGHGIQNLDAVIAHELGHIFGGLDEYGPCNSTETSGPRPTTNANCGSPTPDPCLMRHNHLTLCPATVEHLGWVDLDGDGHVDARIPVINALVPDTAPDGAIVLINGSGLGEARSVVLARAGLARFEILSDAQLRIFMPPGTGVDTVSVTTTLGRSLPGPRSTFTYGVPGRPVVTALTPRSGAAGDVLVAVGVGLVRTNLVSFVGVGSASFRVVSDAQLEITVPPGSGADVDIVVSTDFGASAASPILRFTYVVTPGRRMGLADELIGGSLGFAQDRLAEFRDTALSDVPRFAHAAGRDGFVDDGAVGSRLMTARGDLTQVPAELQAGNFEAAATHLAGALRAVDEAAKLVGGLSLRDLLIANVDWAGVTPTGLAQQLGLSLGQPSGLRFQDDGFVFEVQATQVSLAPSPLTLGFDKAVLTARLRPEGEAPALAIVLALNGLEAGIGGGPISALLGGATGSAKADAVLGVDTKNGLTLSGGTAKQAVVPARASVGPLDLREMRLGVVPDRSDTIDIGSTVTIDLGGVVTATVEGGGVRVRIDAGAATGGSNPLAVELKAPTAIGLLLDTGIVRGGGFLGVRPGGYGGALQLKLGPIEVKAVGLLTLDPDFALVVVMSVEFSPPIDLSFGFTLNAVGGVIGIEHRLDTDALRAGFSAGALDHILFPVDPVAAAPAILSTLVQVFPVDPGSIVIGPMIEVGWGRPVSFLTARLGVILSLPDPLIVIIGRVRIALPAPDLPIIDLRATVYGEITPEHLLIRVSLNGSRIAGFTVGGDIGLLLGWGGSAEFAISAGGFHPRYDPPRKLAGMQRLNVDLSPPAILTLRAESYFALTTNSVQLGSHVEMGADLGVVDVSGYFTFDALIIFSPHFGFMVDLAIGLTVRVFGVTLLGVHIELHVSGTSPWRAEGSAEVEVLWCSVDVNVGPFTWGDDDNPPPASADPRQLVFDALNRNPGAWQSLTPPDADRVVRLKQALPSATDVTVHPMGLFDVRQHAIPLETVITRVGPNPVPVGQQRVHFGVPLVDSMPAGALSEVTDLFSAGNFLDLKDDEKLSRPSFESMPAGARIRPPGEKANFDASLEAQLRYETFVCDENGVIGAHSAPLFDTLLASSTRTALAAGSAGRTELRAAQRYATVPDPIVLADPGDVRMVSKATVAATDPESVTYTHAAERVLAADVQLARLGVA